MIILLYMSDTPQHVNVVNKFASYVKLHSSCLVNLVNTSTLANNSAEMESVVRTALFAANAIIAVHSEGPSIRRNIIPFCSSSTVSMSRNALAAVLELLQQNELLNRNKLLHVSFHYTSPDFVCNAKFGQKFRLVAEMPALIGRLLGGGVPPVCTGGCLEGSELLQAFADAGGFELYDLEIALVPPFDADDSEHWSVSSSLFNERAKDFRDTDEMDDEQVKVHELRCLHVSSFTAD